MNQPTPSLCRIALVAFVLFVGASSASADSWIFQRSYYSHDPVQEVRVNQYSQGGPYFTRPRGAYVNSGYRHNRSTINIRGRSYDHTNVFESWIQTGEQF